MFRDTMQAAFGSTPAYTLISPTGFDQYVPHTMQAGFGD